VAESSLAMTGAFANLLLRRILIMNLTNWMPLNDIDRMLNRLYPMSMRLDDDFPGLKLLNTDLKWRPSADISENGSEFLIRADLPDVEKKDIHIEITNDLITLKGERKVKKTTEDEKQHRIESFYGSFERSFSLPPNVDQDAISAICDKGVLTIHLPKRKSDKPESPSRKVDVK
jgi:HSP20 family protein